MGKRNQQKGTALITVLSLATVLLGLGALAATHVMREQKSTQINFAKYGQASNIAQAGLQEGLGWFKQKVWVRQQVGEHDCKDEAFAPVYDSDPEARETDNAAIGLVRDIQIDRNVYGRYILRKNNCTGPENPHAVRDISAAKGRNSTSNSNPNEDGTGKLIGDGNVWYLESEGIIYQRRDFSKNSDGIFLTGPENPPNRILNRASAAMEISRLAINVGSAPITLFAASGPNHSFGARCRIVGTDPSGNADYAVLHRGYTPDINSTLRTPSSLFRNPLSQDVTPESVFAVTQQELRAMADNIYTNITEIPTTALPFSITYLDGNFTFDFNKPLQGGGVLFVNGDLTLANNSNSVFSGVVYVTGHLNIGQDNAIAGAVIANRMTCNPSNGYSDVEFNRSLVNTVRSKLALYRENNLTHVIQETK